MFLCKWMNLLGYKTRKMERFQSNLFSRYTSLFRNKSFGICFNLKFNNFCVSDGCSRWLQTWKWDEMEARTPWHVTRDTWHVTSPISRVWVKWTLNCDESRRKFACVRNGAKTNVGCLSHNFLLPNPRISSLISFLESEIQT